MTAARNPDPAALVRHTIRLSRTYAAKGNPNAARKIWRIASRLSLRCDGISGADRCGDAYGSIVLESGLVAFSPVPLVEKREAA